MKAHFLQAMNDLQQMMSDAAMQVEHAVNLSVRAIAMNNVAIADTIIANDSKIDSFEIKIEEECLKILALYQPVASDLRQVVTILKINSEIERAGDLAVNIAERVSDMVLYKDKKIERFDFNTMVKVACDMFKKSLDAMCYHDVVVASEVIGMDDTLDEMHRSSYSKVREFIVKYPAESQYYMDCLTVSRCLERIGDIATNICEDVIYSENGRIVRHQHEGADNGK